MDEALTRTGDVGPVRGLIVDYTGSESLPQRTVWELEAMARFYASQGARYRARLALVAATDVGYGLLRIVSAHTERRGIDVVVFRNYTSAIQWINAMPSITPRPRPAARRAGTFDAEAR